VKSFGGHFRVFFCISYRIREGKSFNITWPIVNFIASHDGTKRRYAIGSYSAGLANSHPYFFAVLCKPIFTLLLAQALPWAPLRRIFAGGSLSHFISVATTDN